MKPLCFVLMPFGRKPAHDGRMVDFDAIYTNLIKPAIDAAGLEPLRADQEMTGGLIHKAMPPCLSWPCWPATRPLAPPP